MLESAAQYFHTVLLKPSAFDCKDKMVPPFIQPKTFG